MILILSSENDSSTTRVIKWLRHYNQPFLRLNEKDEVLILKLTDEELVFKIKNLTVKLSEIISIWYRRGNFNIDLISSNSGDKNLERYKENEKKEIVEYVHNLLRKKRNLNNYNYCSVNKLDVLKYCRETGLNKAKFLITQSKKELLKFYNIEGPIISKAVKSTFSVVSEEGRQSSLTSEIKLRDITNLPETFTPTFFQKCIKKKYEVRTFCLSGEFYSMAIFSQKNTMTQTDYRNYDLNFPNRTVPFQLPEWYEDKINNMLKIFQINSASIDTIISPENEFYLLDINPIGQFGMTSMPCNYNLEKIIAEYLIKDKREE